MAEDITGLAIKGAFIRDNKGLTYFVGKCWPEDSVWIDFINSNACKFWRE